MSQYKEEDFTPWFSGEQKPSRPGVYQRETSLGSTFYAYYDGYDWYSWGPEIYYAVTHYKEKSYSSAYSLRWRGLRANKSTQASLLINRLRSGWKSWGDLLKTGISNCPWKRIAETGDQYLKPGERIERKKENGLVYLRVTKD